MSTDDKQQHAYTVLALMYRDQDAASLQKQMPDGFELADPASYDPEHIDLCIVDALSWEAGRDELRAVRETQKPLHVPIMLMGKAETLGRLPVDALEEVDQLLPTPISPNMLQARLRNMGKNRKQNRNLVRYKQALDGANAGIILTDYRQPDTPIIYANQTFCEMTGYNREEIMGQNCRFLQGDDRDQPARETLRKAINEGKACRVTMRNYFKDGTLWWNDLSIHPIRNKEGEITHFVGTQHDITQQVENQQEIEEREQQWSTLVQEAPDMVMISTGWNGKIEFINQAGATILGVNDPNDLTGENILDLTKDSPQYSDIEKDMRNALERELAPSEPRTITRIDGETRHLEVRAAPIQYKNEKAVLTVGRDVTETYQTSQELKREYQKFSQLFQNSPGSIAIQDPKGDIKSVNPAFENLFGYEEEEVIGKNLDHLLTATDEERKQAENLTQQYIVTPQITEDVRYDKDGNPIPVLIGGAPVKIEGELQFLFAIYTDISEQKRLEEEKRKLLEQERLLRAKAVESRKKFKKTLRTTPLGIALCEGSDHRLTFVNDSYRELVRKKELVGRTVEEAFPEMADQEIMEVLDHVFATGETYSAEEQLLKLWDEINEEWFDLVLTFEFKPMRDEEGKTYGIFTSVINETEKVQNRKELEDRLDEKKTLLAEIHHRVKNNLAVVSGLLEMQKDESDNEEAQKQLSDAFGRIQSIALVHEQLYEEAESDAQINLKKYLPKLLDSLKKVAATKDKDVTTAVHADDVYIPLDQAVSTGLMVSELLINAFKHAFQDKQEGHIAVTADSYEDQLTLQLSDDGTGLPEDFSMEESGGMGMQIISTLLAQIEAQLSYDSTPGEGTVFTVQIPLKTED